MKLKFEKVQYQKKEVLDEPSWAEKVPRWYQLDGFALAMTELIYSCEMDFDVLVLASPGGSNVTDVDFVKSGACRAQKFVHTLPNIRASMALQSIDKICELICLQAGSHTLSEGIQEFQALSREGRKPALVSVTGPKLDPRAEKLQIYTAWMVGHSDVEVGEKEAPKI